MIIDGLKIILDTIVSIIPKKLSKLENDLYYYNKPNVIDITGAEYSFGISSVGSVIEQELPFKLGQKWEIYFTNSYETEVKYKGGYDNDVWNEDKDTFEVHEHEDGTLYISPANTYDLSPFLITTKMARGMQSWIHMVNFKSVRIVCVEGSITEYNTKKIPRECLDLDMDDFDARITNHEKRYGKTEFCLTDEVTNSEYIVKMHNGNLIYFSKCVGIKVKSTVPDLSVLNSGDFNPGDIIVTAVCQDGTEREITNYTYTKPITSSTVVVTYEELGETFTTSIDVNIVSVEEALIDFNYTTNNDGTYTITGWKGTLNGVTSTRMIVPKSSKVIF